MLGPGAFHDHVLHCSPRPSGKTTKTTTTTLSLSCCVAGRQADRQAYNHRHVAWYAGLALHRRPVVPFRQHPNWAAVAVHAPSPSWPRSNAPPQSSSLPAKTRSSITSQTLKQKNDPPGDRTHTHTHQRLSTQDGHELMRSSVIDLGHGYRGCHVNSCLPAAASLIILSTVAHRTAVVWPARLSAQVLPNLARSLANHRPAPCLSCLAKANYCFTKA